MCIANPNGTYDTKDECYKKGKSCTKYACKEDNCVEDNTNGRYESKVLCNVLCNKKEGRGEFCGNIQKYLFDYLDIDLECKARNKQDLNIFLLIAIIWIGILLF